MTNFNSINQGVHALADCATGRNATQCLWMRLIDTSGCIKIHPVFARAPVS